MRTTLWLAGLFAAAVALALFAGENQGTVTLFWPPHRIDMSVNLVVLLLLGAFALLYLALRTWAVLLDLPRQARRWRAQQRERAAHEELLDALVQLLAGRYVRARKAAEGAQARQVAMDAAGEALPHGATLRAVAHLIAAESAQALQQRDLRDAQFNQALALAGGSDTTPELREGLLLRSARWALEDRDAAGALARLDELPQGAARRTLALRTKLKAARQAGRGAQALDTARLLAKHRAFSVEAARSLVRQLVAEQIRDTHDAHQLQAVWAALDAGERGTPELSALAARRLIALGGDAAQARAWLRPALDAWLEDPASLSGTPRLRLMDALLDSLAADAGGPEGAGVTDPELRQWLARLEAAQQAFPRDAGLQYLVGMACLHQRLWGRAQVLLSQAVQRVDDAGLRRRAWRALAELAAQRGDEAEALKAWQQAGRD